jgi:mRNA-degrading endonuclease RelE of RelBE toxin-antitoxin system
MHAIQFSPRAERDLSALPVKIQERIQQKLKDNARVDNPLVRAEPVVNLPPSTHRFRIGDYRALFYIESGCIFVERIEIRNKAYRRF